MPRRAPWVTLLLLLATFVLGIGLRFGHFGQPPVVRKYGGSATWAMEIYWLFSGFLWSPVGRTWGGGGVRRGAFVDHVGTMETMWWKGLVPALLSGMVGTAVEFVKLIHTPWLEWFRGTLAGVLLLGRFFSWWDILAYWGAVVLAAALDAWVMGKRQRA